MTPSLPRTAAGADPSRLAVGILLVVGAGIALASMDAVGKHLSAELHIVQIVWARYFFHSLVVTAVLLRAGNLAFLRARRPALQGIRATCLFGATLCMYTALTRVPLADATAVQFFAPVLVSLISIRYLGERPRPARLAAAVLGFAAVLLIIRPGPNLDPFMLLPLGAAMLLSVYFLMTRMLAGHDHAGATQFYTTAVGAVVLTAAAPFVWDAPTATQLILMISVGALGAAGHFAIITGFARAPASLLSPFLYSQLLFAAALSVAFFGDALDALTVCGALLLVASGLVLWRIERPRA